MLTVIIDSSKEKILGFRQMNSFDLNQTSSHLPTYLAKAPLSPALVGRDPNFIIIDKESPDISNFSPTANPS